VSNPRALESIGRLAFDKYMPTSAERSAVARRGLKSRRHPLRIMLIQ
jgi:hypothetical protein